MENYIIGTQNFYIQCLLFQNIGIFPENIICQLIMIQSSRSKILNLLNPIFKLISLMGKYT